MSALLDKLQKASTIKQTDILNVSKFFHKKDTIPTMVPAINIALSGDMDVGFEPGLTIWAGPSKHFKTLFSLLMLKAYQDKYKDGVCLLYDSEFGAPLAYFESVGIDTSRVIHCPITDIEQLKFDIMAQLEQINAGDRVFIMIDSVGNLASKKEVEDALNAKSVADMTRAKQLKSLFRMVTPHLTIKDIPMVVVNHTYQTQEMYSKAVVSGGTGIYYSAQNIFIVGRQQEKDGDEYVGFNFVINVEKSRYTREKSKIPVTVLFEGGVNRYSALLDIALESKHVVKPKAGWYSKVDKTTGELVGKNYREAETNSSAFWKSIMDDETFKQFVRDKYQVSAGDMITAETIEDDIASIELEE